MSKRDFIAGYMAATRDKVARTRKMAQQYEWDYSFFDPDYGHGHGYVYEVSCFRTNAGTFASAWHYVEADSEYEAEQKIESWCYDFYGPDAECDWKLIKEVDNISDDIYRVRNELYDTPYSII